MKSYFAPSLFDFEGTWFLTRRIVDHRAGTTGHFEGTATFQRDAFGLAYHETGLLHLPGHTPFHAERRYRWREDSVGIHVDFDDGREFHTFGGAELGASHWCDPDTYIVTYDFETWPVWHSNWDVTGPRKAYQMVNSFSPKQG